MRLAGWACLAIAVTLTVLQVSKAADNEGGPCTEALASGSVCEAANRRAVEIIKAGNLEAVIALQDVRTGNLLAFAGSDLDKFGVISPLQPLSPVKLLVAAIWLDHEKAAGALLPNSDQLLTDSLVSGNDNAGRRLASALREAIGADKVLNDLKRYGFAATPDRHGPKNDSTFWAGLASEWIGRLTPAMSYHLLDEKTSAKDWEDTLSLGEERFVVTALHLSRFLQAAGNGGIMLPPVAYPEQSKSAPASTLPATATRVMSETAAVKLQAVMRGTVERGTAKSAAPILAGTGWTMGGKTGTGPDPASKAVGPGSDGCFAGLIFDAEGKARFTVVTYVKHGGLGGGNAARISAELARFVAGVP